MPESIRVKFDASGWRDVVDDDDHKTSDRLRERLTHFLLAENVVCLIGSGASIAVGGPSMNELWSVASGQSGFDEALKRSGYKVPVDGNGNVEEFLSRCQLAEEFNSSGPDLKTFLKAVEKAIVAKCRGFLTNETTLASHCDLLRRLARLPNDKSRVRVFTTNYDVCLERAAGLIGLPVIDGFSHTYPQRFDGRHYEYDLVRRIPNQREPLYVDGVFHLYKLHGSVDWKNSNGDIERDSATDEAVMIYPRATKYQLSYRAPFLEMMARFQFALRQANTTTVFAIGFGFNDDHLSEPILSALASNPHFNLVVATKALESAAEGEANGRANSYLNRFSKFVGNDAFENVVLLDCDFGQFVTLVPNPAGQLENQRFVELVKALRVEDATCKK